MLKAYPMEKGSLHPMGQVVTPHQSKKKRYVGLILKSYIRQMNVGPKSQRYSNLKDTAKTIRSMDIENLNVDPCLLGHLTR